MPAGSEHWGYEWAADPERARAAAEEWRAEERVRGAANRQRRLRELATRQQGLCTWCRLPLPANLGETEIDHIIPRQRGGPNLKWNCQVLHRRCNRKKGLAITPQAEALAGEHGITVTAMPARPKPQNYFGRAIIGNWINKGIPRF